MSTNLNCVYFEPRPGRWYYALEDADAPKNAWNWLEHADVVGPFRSFTDAQTYLHRHNANPGGYNRCSYELFAKGEAKALEMYERLALTARYPSTF